MATRRRRFTSFSTISFGGFYSQSGESSHLPFSAISMAEIFEKGEDSPYSYRSKVHISGEYLRTCLYGQLELVFVPDSPTQELEDDSIGTIHLQTNSGRHDLFSFSEVTFDDFQYLANDLRMQESQNPKKFTGTFPCIER